MRCFALTVLALALMGASAEPNPAPDGNTQYSFDPSAPASATSPLPSCRPRPKTSSVWSAMSTLSVPSTCPAVTCTTFFTTSTITSTTCTTTVVTVTPTVTVTANQQYYQVKGKLFRRQGGPTVSNETELASPPASMTAQPTPPPFSLPTEGRETPSETLDEPTGTFKPSVHTGLPYPSFSPPPLSIESIERSMSTAWSDLPYCPEETDAPSGGIAFSTPARSGPPIPWVTSASITPVPTGGNSTIVPPADTTAYSSTFAPEPSNPLVYADPHQKDDSSWPFPFKNPFAGSHDISQDELEQFLELLDSFILESFSDLTSSPGSSPGSGGDSVSKRSQLEHLQQLRAQALRAVRK